MFKVLAIAWREFKHTALTKAFIIGTIVFPLLIWGGMLVVPLLVKPGVQAVEGVVAVVEPAGDVTRAAQYELERSREGWPQGERPITELAEEAAAAGPFGARVELNVTFVAHEPTADLDALRERVREGDLLALAVVEPAAEPQLWKLTFFTPPQINPDHAGAVRRLLSSAVVRARAEAAGLNVDDVRAMLRSPVIETRRVTAEGEAAAGHELQRMLPIAFMILLWIAAFASGNYLLTTTIEEKSNKVMEVLLSAVSPLQLMAGKILGQAIVGLATIAVYGALGIGALIYFERADFIQASHIVYLVLFFFMAYFLVASMMAAIGSAVSDLQEAHALITPAMLLLFVPMILFVPVSADPNGTLAVVTSFIPIFTPFVMIIRVTATDPPGLGQILASLAVGYAGVLLMVWMAARIFRVGVLMYGKPPSPLEMLKWMRYS
jgi:ABC-2 type transport system permease protein